ncbi:MAG: CotH kinase family protein [Gemmatirosa sp.]|nr:CotH kinase family protein [Gemmatirosa sp.]
MPLRPGPRARRALACTLARALARALALALGAGACKPGSDAAVVAPPAPPIATSLPMLRITTTSGFPVTSKDDYVPGAYVLADTLGVTRQQGALEIKGHGNSTWVLFPKKPYHLKLASSAPMLAMPANKHWILLANYADKTLLRNAMAFDLSRRLSFAYTPRYEDVDVYVNGSYEGVYELAEHVRVAPDRVNVPELKVTDTSATDITGGYLVQVDETRGEDFCFSSTHTSMVFCLKSPDTLLQPGWERQRAYIERYVRRLDSTIFAPTFADPQTGYAAYLDVASLVDCYLLDELFKNVDGNLRRGTYFSKPRGGKLTCGPVWDYDISMGNANYLSGDLADGWYVRTAPWYTRLFEDPAFEARVRARWRELRANGALDRPVAFASEHSTYLGEVQRRNFTRWPILDTWVWPNRVVTGSYFAEVRATQDWLRARIQWMDGQLGR